MSRKGTAEVDRTEADEAAVAQPLVHDGETVPLVPRGGLWEGQVAIVGKTLIDGAVNGSLRGPGELVLGTGSRIEGVIDCEILDSRGEITGPVTARSRARLRSGAYFEGDLEAPSVEVEDDAVWNGVARVGG